MLPSSETAACCVRVGRLRSDGVAKGRRALLLSGFGAMGFTICVGLFMTTVARRGFGVAETCRASSRAPPEAGGGDFRFLTDGRSRDVARLAVENKRTLGGDAMAFSDCPSLWSALDDDPTFIAQGWTKAVYRARYRGRGVAVKVISFDSHDMKKCLSAGRDETGCYLQASEKLLKEIRILRQISHVNVAQLIAYCVPTEVDVTEPTSLIALVMELGESVDLLKMLQMSWESRLRMAIGVAQLVEYLSCHELVLNDFKKEQFVLVDGVLKLSDVDDIGRLNPSCTVDADCVNHVGPLNFTLRSPCVQDTCQGFNDRLNVLNAGRHFMDVLLPYGAPTALWDHIRSIVERYRTGSDTAGSLLADVQELLVHYSKVRTSYSGHTTMNNVGLQSLRGFVSYPDREFTAGNHDYTCRHALSSLSCSVAVLDEEEAAQLCEADNRCKAFIVTSQFSWTGRRMVHFKSDIFGHVAAKGNVTLYVKRQKEKW